MRCVVNLIVLVAALFTPWDVCVADTVPQTLGDFIQQRGLGPVPLTTAEWCELVFLSMAQANDQTRTGINDMARDRGCYAEAQPIKDEEVRVMICKNIPALLSEPGNSTRQKLTIMEMARGNGCAR